VSSATGKQEQEAGQHSEIIVLHHKDQQCREPRGKNSQGTDASEAVVPLRW